MTDEQQNATAELGTVRCYDDLHAALRARAEQLNVSRVTIDEVAGLPSGYAAALLSSPPFKRMGFQSITLLLGALGCKLILAEDHDAYARVANRLQQREKSRCRTVMPEDRPDPVSAIRELMREIGARGGRARAAAQTPAQRSDLARAGARARWRRRSRDTRPAGGRQS